MKVKMLIVPESDPNADGTWVISEQIEGYLDYKQLKCPEGFFTPRNAIPLSEGGPSFPPTGFDLRIKG